MQQLGQPDFAVRLLAATAELRRRTGLGELPESGAVPGEISEVELLAASRQALDEEAFATAWTASATTSLEALLVSLQQDLAGSSGSSWIR